jgi:cell division protein FtsB
VIGIVTAVAALIAWIGVTAWIGATAWIVVTVRTGAIAHAATLTANKEV